MLIGMKVEMGGAEGTKGGVIPLLAFVVGSKVGVVYCGVKVCGWTKVVGGSDGYVGGGYVGNAVNSDRNTLVELLLITCCCCIF